MESNQLKGTMQRIIDKMPLAEKVIFSHVAKWPNLKDELIGTGYLALVKVINDIENGRYVEITNEDGLITSTVRYALIDCVKNSYPIRLPVDLLSKENNETTCGDRPRWELVLTTVPIYVPYDEETEELEGGNFGDVDHNMDPDPLEGLHLDSVELFVIKAKMSGYANNEVCKFLKVTEQRIGQIVKKIQEKLIAAGLFCDRKSGVKHVCAKCGKEKLSSDFYKRSNGKLQSMCKDCYKEWNERRKNGY